MKKTLTFILALALFGTLHQACKTDIDLYEDYKDITVVYGLLDCQKDTNYIKINKAFLGPGNALEIALIADSCNYPEKLNSRIIEYSSSSPNGSYTPTRTFELDTITIHNKEYGSFYAPDQLVYYTTERIRNNTDHRFYKYALEIDHSDTTLRAETNIVGGDSFVILINQLNVTNTTPTGVIKWNPCPYAVIYGISVDFRFTEVGPTNDSVQRCITWDLGTYPISNLSSDYGIFNVSYRSLDFYQTVAHKLGADTLNNVERLLSTYPITVKISAGGEELYNFIAVNGPSSSIVQNVPEYTNIIGGYGVFSSRTNIEKKIKLSPQSVLELKQRTNWHFRQM